MAWLRAAEPPPLQTFAAASLEIRTRFIIIWFMLTLLTWANIVLDKPGQALQRDTDMHAFGLTLNYFHQIDLEYNSKVEPSYII